MKLNGKSMMRSTRHSRSKRHHNKTKRMGKSKSKRGGTLFSMVNNALTPLTLLALNNSRKPKTLKSRRKRRRRRRN